MRRIDFAVRSSGSKNFLSAKLHSRPLAAVAYWVNAAMCKESRGLSNTVSSYSSKRLLATFRLAPQARHELARTCTGHDLLSLLLPTTMPHMSGVQDEDSRAECDKMAE